MFTLPRSTDDNLSVFEREGYAATDIIIGRQRWDTINGAETLYPDTLSRDKKRFGILDITPIGAALYSVLNAPPESSNMALAQAISQRLLATSDAKTATCNAGYWVGPNLPGEIEDISAQDVDGKTHTFVLSVVGDIYDRYLLITRGNEEIKPIKTEDLLNLSQSLRLIK